jgi:hypothetical protein
VSWITLGKDCRRYVQNPPFGFRRITHEA